MNSKTPLVKNQHYVPVVHLKQFSDDNTELLAQILDKGGDDIKLIPPNTPNSMGHKNKLYEPYSKTPNQLERFFSEFEGRLGYAIKEVLEELAGKKKTKIFITAESLRVLSDHAAILYYRHPSAITSGHTVLTSKIALQLPLNHDPKLSVPLFFSAFTENNLRLPSRVSILVTREHIPFNLSHPIFRDESKSVIMPLSKNSVMTFGRNAPHQNMLQKIAVDVYYEQGQSPISLSALNVATYSNELDYPHHYVTSISSSDRILQEISNRRQYQQRNLPGVVGVRGNGFYVSERRY